MKIDPNLYPFQSHYLERDGLRLHYLDEGHGEPVVMLHGNPTWSFYYRELVKTLRGNYRCIVPDHIGCGLSDKPSANTYPYTLQNRVDDLERLLDHLGLAENLTLVLHDWGGMIGMAYATRHPERIRRFVILNTSAFHLPPTKRFPWPLWLARTPVGAFLIRRFNAFSAVASRVCCTRVKLSPAVRRHYRAPYDSWQNRIATLRFVQDIPLRPSDPAYPIVTQVQENARQFHGRPMFIAWGLKDFVFDKHFLALWKETFPNAQLHEYPDCGHYILEDARDDLLPKIHHFLQST